jgi:hypothetical protein
MCLHHICRTLGWLDVTGGKKGKSGGASVPNICSGRYVLSDCHVTERELQTWWGVRAKYVLSALCALYHVQDRQGTSHRVDTSKLDSGRTRHSPHMVLRLFSFVLGWRVCDLPGRFNFPEARTLGLQGYQLAYLCSFRLRPLDG